MLTQLCLRFVQLSSTLTSPYTLTVGVWCVPMCLRLCSRLSALARCAGLQSADPDRVRFGVRRTHIVLRVDFTTSTSNVNWYRNGVTPGATSVSVSYP